MQKTNRQKAIKLIIGNLIVYRKIQDTENFLFSISLLKKIKELNNNSPLSVIHELLKDCFIEKISKKELQDFLNN